MTVPEADGGGLPAPPLVSVGVPVFNEGRFLERTLSTLASQDYGRIEVIVSDNGSDDATQAIAERYAERHAWIRYVRHDRNRGSVFNYQFTLDQARGELFAWLSGHDRWAPDYLSVCVDLLRHREGAVIAFADTAWIDENDDTVGRESGYSDTRDRVPVERFFTVLWGNMHPIFGVIRTAALRRLGRIPACAGTDLVILCALSLEGDFVHSGASLTYRRMNRAREGHGVRVARYRSHEFGLARTLLDRLSPYIKLSWHLVRVVARARLGWAMKASALVALVSALPARYLAGKERAR